MDAIDLFGMETSIRGVLGPWVGVLFSVIVIFLLKDVIFALIKGLKFKLRPGFESGDNCYIDKEHATIVKIGLLETIFEIDNGRGKVWRYIPNEQLDSLVLERIIVPKEEPKFF
jgi:hypothetical protein